ARFPWSTEGRQVDLNAPARQEKEFGPSCGWPHDRIHRDIRMAGGIGRIDALLISMLSGWWFFSLEAWISPQLVSQPVIFLGCSLLVHRGGLYFRGYAPPISIGGRIATFRWIIPGYDQAGLAFLLVLLIIPAVLVLAQSLRLDLRQSTPV